MKKAEIVEQICIRCDVSKASADRMLTALIDVITERMAEGKDILIPHVGRLKPAYRKARTGRNPMTGEPIAIAASRGVSFKAVKKLKDAVQLQQE